MNLEELIKEIIGEYLEIASISDSQKTNVTQKVKAIEIKIRGKFKNLNIVDVSGSLPIEVPILIGRLNKTFGYNGFEPIEIGTDVFSFENMYYFKMKLTKGEGVAIQKFYKDDLAPYIDFIGRQLNDGV